MSGVRCTEGSGDDLNTSRGFSWSWRGGGGCHLFCIEAVFLKANALIKQITSGQRGSEEVMRGVQMRIIGGWRATVDSVMSGQDQLDFMIN